jgi:hypothetical protein
MAPGGAAATGTKGPRQKNKYIYIQLASFLPLQFSNNPPLALPFFSFFFFFFFFSLSLSLPSLLLSCKPFGKQKSAQERNRRGDDWKHKLSFISAFFLNIENLANFSSQKQKKQQIFFPKTSPILYYSIQEKTQMFFLKILISRFFQNNLEKKMTKFVQNIHI